MTIDALKETLHRAPFRSFKIRMTSGKEYVVDHPDFVSASRSYRRLYVSTPVEDRVEVVDTLMIESIEYTGGAAVASSSE